MKVGARHIIWDIVYKGSGMRLSIAVLMGVLTLAGAGRADNLTGNKVLEICEADDPVQYSLCAGYMIGLNEGEHYGAMQANIIEMKVRGIPAPDNEQLNTLIGLSIGYCPPENAQIGQLVEVAINYLSRHPETRHNSARSLIVTAWAEAFPCG